VLPFVEVGLGPQFMTLRHGFKAKVHDWAWTLGLEGQMGFIFRLKGPFGLRVGAGFSSLSFYSKKQNLGGAWITASLLVGLPRGRTYEPPPEPYYEPPSVPPPAGVGAFYFDAWITYVDGDPGRPVLHARTIREVGFEDDIGVWVALPDGSEFEMPTEGLEDPDLHAIPIYILGMECGQSQVTVWGKAGWTERSQPVGIYLPCPVMPEGM
jgi:hypothetical protein